MMNNINILHFKQLGKANGHLVSIEGDRHIPFEPKRVYYISKVASGERRGFHAHKALQQVLVCVEGAVKILVKNAQEEQIIELKDDCTGLYVGPMIWREMYDFTEYAVLLVLASEHYDEQDYIRDYSGYIELAQEYFKNKE